MARRGKPIERFFRYVDITAGGCWAWTGGRFGDKRNYGAFLVRTGVTRRAHKWLWEQSNGPVPAGLVLDHTCRNTLCVNPAHLEPVTSRVNVVERGTGITARNARKTHCVRGHALIPENLVKRSDRRECKTCANERRRASQ